MGPSAAVCMSLMRTRASFKSLPTMSWCQRKFFYTTTSKLKDDLLFSNPIDRLQPFCQIPIVPESDNIFKPTMEELQEGSSMFEKKNFKDEVFKFIGSYPNPHIMPHSEVPEVAFIGKSNVGKSSLLSQLFTGIPDLKVRTSSKPGHTKLMNVFKVGDSFNLIDMPGYGFNMPENFGYSVEAYMKSRRSVMNFILFDGRAGMTNNDQKYFKQYTDLKIPLTMVLTKIDLANQGTLLRSLTATMKFRDESNAASCFPQPFLVSSKTGEGLAMLQTFIAYVTGNMAIKSLS